MRLRYDFVFGCSKSSEMIIALRNCLIVFAIIFSPLFANVHKRSPASKCRDKMDRGSPCPNGKKAQLSWFYDVETNVCLSFKYNGCGGNSNRFDSIELCEMNCIPPGFGTCALNKEPFKNSNGQQRVCSGPEVEKCPDDYKCKHLASFGWFYDIETNVCLSFKYNGCGGNSNRFDSIELCEMNCIPLCSGPEVEKCPDDYKCKHLASFGVCCPKKSEELFAKNYEAACSVGKTVKTERRGRKSNLLGKSCEDDFCPAGSNCVQEEIFAHCCD
uniref:BPTI/Kunitz inhibitor domain-containing protein n=1 Tax=Ascaris lumbricoides TaxID=6252 RepID=A0A0M3IR52_ASCLU